jgi:thioester reductase-like protein
LTRRSQPKEDILEALAKKGLEVLPFRASKIVALTSSLDKSDLGVGEKMLSEMRRSVSLIIHTAWPVNFNLPLVNFEPHIQGVHNLIQFSLSVHLPAPAVMLFCSSISTALGAKSSEIDETPLEDLNDALEMGYGRSKLIGERIVSNARKLGARVHSLRIGQVSGHSKRGLWNDSEAIPLMIRSALTLKALPQIDTTCSWLPVDKLACSILEIAKACSAITPDDREVDWRTGEYVDDTVYNISNPRVFSWSSLLQGLQRAGFDFETVSFDKWLQLLRDSGARGEEMVNPAVKLADHYEAMYGEAAPPPKTFVTEKAERDSNTLRNGRLRVIQDGILTRYAQDWLRRWKST